MARPIKGPGGRPRGLTGEVTSVRLGAETVRRAHAIAASRGESLAVFLDGLIRSALREPERDLAARLTGSSDRPAAAPPSGPEEPAPPPQGRGPQGRGPQGRGPKGGSKR